MQDLIHGMHILQSCLKSWHVSAFLHLVAACHYWGESKNRSDPGDGHSAVCSVVVEVISWLVSACSQGDHDFLLRYACVRDDTPFAPLSCVLEWPRSVNGEDEKTTASAFPLVVFPILLAEDCKSLWPDRMIPHEVEQLFAMQAATVRLGSASGASVNAEQSHLMSCNCPEFVCSEFGRLFFLWIYLCWPQASEQSVLEIATHLVQQPTISRNVNVES